MPPLLWLIVAFLAGLLLEWALEILIFRRRMFEQAETELARHTQALREWTSKLRALQITLGERDKELLAARAANGKLQAELDACTDARASLGQERDRSKEQANQLEAGLAAALKAKAELEAALGAREAEQAGLRAELDSRLSQAKRLDADVVRLTDAATAARTIKTLEGRSAEMAAQLGRLRDELSACTAARASLEADLKARDTEIERLRVYTIPAPVRSDSGPTLTVPAPLTPAEVAARRNRRADDETPFETLCPQHLSDVDGIGAVYETRLYGAGVGTFWELSRLSDDELLNILKMTELQASRADFDAIRTDARRLAQETRSLGRKWLRCPPDDFEPLKGIGFTFEKRLYDAGICTFEALASATVELLEEICQAPARFRPDYAAWIEQAKALAAQKAQRQDKA